MAAVGELADLAHPKLVGQLRAALSQLHGHGLASGQCDAVQLELFLSPILLRKLVIGQNGNPLLPHLREQLRTVAFPVEHQGEPVSVCIFRQPPLLLRRLGHMGLHPRNQILGERGDQPGVHFLVPVQEGLAVHGVDPVIGRGPQTQPLAGHIVARQSGLVWVIHAHGAVAVEIQFRVVLPGNPFVGHRGVPAHGLSHVLA